MIAAVLADLDTPASGELAILIARINTREPGHEAGSVVHAEAQGNDLLEAKVRAGHGNWERQVRENLTICPEQVRRYIRFAKWVKSVVATTDLTVKIAKWREISGNAPAGKDGAPSRPFSLIVEADAIEKWLRGRWDDWPPHMREGFIPTLRNVLDCLEELQT